MWTYFLNNVEAALLLALVMVISMLPMNVFGFRAGTIINPRTSPEGNLLAYTFRVDAKKFTQCGILLREHYHSLSIRRPLILPYFHVISVVFLTVCTS